MSWVYIVFFDDYSEGIEPTAVFSTKEKAQEYIDRRLEEHEDGLPLHEYDSFSIESFPVDVDE